MNKQSLPRGRFKVLLDAAGFSPGKPLVDPPSGNTFSLPGIKRIWDAALEDARDFDLLDYQRATVCVVSGSCKGILQDVVAVAFIEGALYLEFAGETQIERWFPTKECKDLRDGFDAGQGPPSNRFFFQFRAAEGSERLVYRRQVARHNYKTRPKNGESGEKTGKTKKQRVWNLDIRNGVLIGERI